MVCLRHDYTSFSLVFHANKKDGMNLELYRERGQQFRQLTGSTSRRKQCNSNEQNGFYDCKFFKFLL